jgi:hypothetical protein
MWAAVLLAFAALPIYRGVSAFQQARKLGRLSFEPVADAKTTAFREKQLSELAALPRPRKLRMTWKGRIYVVLMLALVILFTIYALQNYWTELNHHALEQRSWLLIWAILVVYGSAFVFFRDRLRERRLLANGELVSGFVTEQSNERYAVSIKYRFKLPAGNFVFCRCNDASRSLYEGMTVPVFYDPENPTRSIPLDCSLTRIA